MDIPVQYPAFFAALNIVFDRPTLLLPGYYFKDYL